MQVYRTDRNYTETEMGPCFQSQNMCGLPCSNLLSYEWVTSLASTAPVLWRIPSVDTTAPVHRGIMISPEELSAWGQQQHWGRQTLQTQTFHSSLANPRAEAEGKGCIDGFVWHNTPSNHQHTMNSKHEEILSLFAFKIQTDSHSKWEERTRI